MNVVVVESPAKAKTINKYLGASYVVLPSYGHVRDLPSKDGSVEPDNDFHMTYQVEPRAAKHLAEINRALEGSGRLILATDPDREGEAISWHVLQALGEKRDLAGIEVERVVFNAITKHAVLDAMAHPRKLDMDLVNAQQARRALDYLVGFTLSPVLWRKLPGARSAGRVQSVALRLVCERENETPIARRTSPASSLDSTGWNEPPSGLNSLSAIAPERKRGRKATELLDAPATHGLPRCGITLRDADAALGEYQLEAPASESNSSSTTNSLADTLSFDQTELLKIRRRPFAVYRLLHERRR